VIVLDHLHRRAQTEEELVLAGQPGCFPDTRQQHGEGEQKQQQGLAGW
jgi:hypothetical protein